VVFWSNKPKVLLTLDLLLRIKMLVNKLMLAVLSLGIQHPFSGSLGHLSI